MQNYVKQNSKSAFASCAAFAASCRSAIVEAAAAATIFTFVKNWERKGLKEKSRDFSTAKNAIILK